MQHIAREVYDFSIIYGDTDSIFITNVRNDNDIMKFIAECFILLEMDVEPAEFYNKFLITKKKHYIGILSDKTKDPIIKGMEGIKSDRPPWINKLQRQFADDIKHGKNPSLNIRREYASIESSEVRLEDLVIRLTLAKNPSEYAKSNLQRIVGNELGLSQGDTLKYYKSNTIGGGTSNPNLLSKRKYLEMLRTTVEESLKLMGLDFNKDVLGQRSLV
jgi:DNA polymerase elongation subunit (family B)